MRGAGSLRVLLLWVLSPLGAHSTQSEGHHVWRLLVTGITAVEGIPEYTAIGMVDDFELGYYSSRLREAIPLQNWVREALGSEYFESKTQAFREYQEGLKQDRKICMQRYNHTSGVHTMQVYVSCEVHGDTAIEGLFQYIYDGQVFLTFDTQTDTWVAASTEAIPFKQYMDANRHWLAYVRYYHMEECVETLKKYVQHGKYLLDQRVPPEVRILTHHSTDGIIVHRCHVTGFYPRDIDVTWVKDGQKTLIETYSSGILPNQDRTYQIQKTLEIDPMDRHTYTCVVSHSSLQTQIIKTASVPAGSWTPGLLAAGITVLLILGLGSAGVLMWKQKRTPCAALSQYVPANKHNGEET